MRRYLTASFALAAFLSSPLALANNGDRIRYDNARFGFTLELPVGFYAGNAPSNGDGRAFRSRNGQINVITYAHYILASFQSEYAEQKKFLEQEGANIVYDRMGDNWFAFSGYRKDGRIFYQRVMKTQDCQTDRIAAFVIIDYPRAAKTQIENDIGWITRSLTGCR